MIQGAPPSGTSVNNMNSRPAVAIGLGLALASGGALAAEPSLELLRQSCEAAREVQLAPLREQAIQDCVSRPRSTRNRAQCEEFYRDFGQGGGTVGGGFRAPMFIDVPECQEYFAEQDRQNSARGSSRR
jgi:predicted glycoside hydrolase/deacetylase ChbG (UPF0249 family)